MQQTEEWLYEDGDNETEYVYIEKLENLKKVRLVIGFLFSRVRSYLLIDSSKCLLDGGSN